jgi:hypothetical protein
MPLYEVTVEIIEKRRIKIEADSSSSAWDKVRDMSISDLSSIAELRMRDWDIVDIKVKED